MAETEIYGGAQFVQNVNADTRGITTELAGRALAEPGFPLAKASVFFRNCAAAGLVHPYTRLQAGKKPYLFRSDQLVIAAVLHRVAEASIADNRLRHKISNTLHMWDANELTPDAPRSPAIWALVEYLNGKRGFSFEIRTYRNERGTVDYECRLRHAESKQGTNFRLDDNWHVRSAFVLHMDDVLAHLTRSRELAN